MRTIGNLRQHYADFMTIGHGKLSNAKNHANVIHPPLFQLPDDTKIIDFLPVMELHCFTGPVNYIYEGLKAQWSKEAADQFEKDAGLWRPGYHGGAFEGNQCMDLLLNLDLLQERAGEENEPLVAALRSMLSVSRSCYSIRLNEDFVETIEDFKEKYLNLGLNLTTKVHAVLFHVRQSCEGLGHGLGIYSEQALESVHHDFSLTWDKYKVNSTDKPSYKGNLRQAVVAYNSHHV